MTIQELNNFNIDDFNDIAIDTFHLLQEYLVQVFLILGPFVLGFTLIFIIWLVMQNIMFRTSF